MTNIKQFPGNKKVVSQLPDEIKETEAYIMNEVLFVNTPTKTVTDFETANQRNRRWGMTMALAIIPHFDQMTPNQGPTLLPKSPSRFFTADSLKELKDRVVYELDRAIEMADLSVNDPEEFMRLHQAEVREYNVDPDNDMN